MAQVERVHRRRADERGRRHGRAAAHRGRQPPNPRSDGHGAERDQRRHDQRRVLPPGQVRHEHDREPGVGAHRAEHVGGGQRHRDDERQHEGPAETLPGHDRQREAAEHAGNAEHRVETQEEQEAEQHARHRREEPIAVDLGARVGEQRREQQRLHHDLGVRVAREPHFDHVERQQPRRRRPDSLAEHPRRSKVHREQPEHRPRTGGPSGAGQAVESVADGNRRGKEVRELPDHPALLRLLNEEAHEPAAVVVGAVLGREEEVAREVRNRRHNGVRRRQGAALRDLHALADVDPGILAADDVLGRREEPPRAEQQERDRHHDGPAGTGRCGAEAQSESGGCGCNDRDADVGGDDPREAVAPDRGERQHRRQGQRDADQDLPEHPLVGVETRPPIAIQARHPEQRGARQPAEDDRLKQRRQQSSARLSTRSPLRTESR